VGKSLDVHLYQLIGGCYTDKFPVSGAVIGIDTPEIMAKVAKDSLKDLGPEPLLLKIKLGIQIHTPWQKPNT
jgi:L-alanine-DL-glutamate epimerase-like enolase superfamily enzyme